MGNEENVSIFIYNHTEGKELGNTLADRWV